MLDGTVPIDDVVGEAFVVGRTPARWTFQSNPSPVLTHGPNP